MMATPFSAFQSPPVKPGKDKKPKSTMSDSNLTILRRYAGCPNPGDVLPKTVLFAETEDTLTVFDAYPKSIFHFLVLPRSQTAPEDKEDELSQPTLLQFGHTAGRSPQSKPRAQNLPEAHSVRNLATMLTSLPNARSKEILLKMQAAALAAKKDIEEEMVRLYGWKWDIWIGFHAIPSMEHLHLHVISADLISEKMKKKKHYNTFHPKLEFFVHLEEVLEWFDAEKSIFQSNVSSLAKRHPILKEELVCFHCEQTMRNIPILKKHLQEEWDNLAKRKKAAHARTAMFEAAAERRRAKADESKKRKSEDVEEIEVVDQDAVGDHSHQDKRQRTEEQ